MATILEMVAEIVSAHVSSSPLSGDQLVEEINKVHAALKALEAGHEISGKEDDQKIAITAKQSIKKNEVICLICGKGGMKTLTRHLSQVHKIKPRAYRKQFGIPSSQSLTAKNFSEARRKMAQERGLADNLAKARAVRAANIATKKAKPAKEAKPAKAVVKPAKAAVKPAKAPVKPAKATKPPKAPRVPAKKIVKK